MFCSKCGTKLSDDALFCMKCGNKVSVFSDNEQNTYLASQQSTSDIESKVNADGNANVSKNFDNLTVENVFSERVNSEIFDDRKSQNRLFTLYSSLIPTVKKIEKHTLEIKKREKKIKSLRDKNGVPHGIGPKIIIAIFVFVLIFQFFNNTLGDLSDSIATLLVNPLLEGIEDWFWLIRIPVWIFLVFGLGILITPLIISIICKIIWLLYFKFIHFKILYSKQLSEAAKLEIECQEIEKEREKICLSIAEELRYVPKKYRTSHALMYFVEAYNNSRVDSLKEAVNLYVADTLAQEQLKGIQDIAKASVAILWNVEEIAEIVGGDVFYVTEDEDMME